jgi:hypothetical protein
MAGHMIDADPQDLAARGVNPIAYRLKDGQLVCSTARKIARVEPNDELGPAQATQRYVLTGMRRQGEIGGLCSNF